MRILGVDPGLERIGYGLIDRKGSRLTIVAHGLIQTPRFALPDRLRQIHDELCCLIEGHRPTVLVTERQLFAVNKTTAMDVAKATGVILLAAQSSGIEWVEYSPPEVKQSVVGNGRADKRQVVFMVRRLLSMAEDPKPDDVADALAIAITHAFRAGAKEAVVAAKSP